MRAVAAGRGRAAALEQAGPLAHLAVLVVPSVARREQRVQRQHAHGGGAARQVAQQLRAQRHAVGGARLAAARRGRLGPEAREEGARLPVAGGRRVGPGGARGGALREVLRGRLLQYGAPPARRLAHPRLQQRQQRAHLARVPVELGRAARVGAEPRRLAVVQPVVDDDDVGGVEHLAHLALVVAHLHEHEEARLQRARRLAHHRPAVVVPVHPRVLVHAAGLGEDAVPAEEARRGLPAVAPQVARGRVEHLLHQRVAHHTDHRVARKRVEYLAKRRLLHAGVRLEFLQPRWSRQDGGAAVVPERGPCGAVRVWVDQRVEDAVATCPRCRRRLLSSSGPPPLVPCRQQPAAGVAGC